MGAPGLNEIATTTLRNRKMDKKLGAKAAADVKKSGTHVPEKDFSSKKKEVKAAGTGKPEKGSAATAMSLPMATGKSTPEAGVNITEKKSWQGSPEDWRQDYHESKRKGISSEQWEDSPSDRLSDNAGERKMNAHASEKVHEAPDYKSGVSAFGNKSKTSHGFGHTAANHDGHLRNSGHGSAHRIGKKR